MPRFPKSKSKTSHTVRAERSRSPGLHTNGLVYAQRTGYALRTGFDKRAPERQIKVIIAENLRLLIQNPVSRKTIARTGAAIVFTDADFGKPEIRKN